MVNFCLVTMWKIYNRNPVCTLQTRGTGHWWLDIKAVFLLNILVYTLRPAATLPILLHYSASSQAKLKENVRHPNQRQQNKRAPFICLGSWDGSDHVGTSGVSAAYLKVVVALEEGTGLKEGGVELAGLGAGVAVDPEEKVVLHVLVADRGRRPHHVRQLQAPEVVDLLRLEKTAKRENGG